MTIGLVGRKVGMMRIFTDEGDAQPVTVLDGFHHVWWLLAASGVTVTAFATRLARPATAKLAE